MQQVSERLWLMRVETEMGNDRVNQTAWDLIPLYATGQWEIVANESWDRDGQWQSESDRVTDQDFLVLPFLTGQREIVATETEMGNYRVNQTDGTLLPL